MDESLVIYYTIELLRILEALHERDIIHGDVKPDNFLIRDKVDNDDPIRANKGLQIIDYGRSIDLHMYPKGTTFVGSCQVDGFQCVEMITGKPWTYQIDTFGLCAVVHFLLHGSYMELVRVDDKWRPKLPFKRYWQVELWTSFFDQLLNSCENYPRPALRPWKQTLENYLIQNPQKVKDIHNALCKQKILLFEYMKANKST